MPLRFLATIKRDIQLNTIWDLADKELQFERISHFVELFTQPISEILNNGEISDADDLLRTSGELGFFELYIHDEEFVTATFDGREINFPTYDFIKFQLQTLPSYFLYYLINKVMLSTDDILGTGTYKNLSVDDEPALIFSDYAAENMDQAVLLLDEIRNLENTIIYDQLAAEILSNQSGLLSWLETDLCVDYKSQIQKYANWNVALMVVAQGQFNPYFNSSENVNLCLDDYTFHNAFVRNFDEGEI